MDVGFVDTTGRHKNINNAFGPGLCGWEMMAATRYLVSCK